MADDATTAAAAADEVETEEVEETQTVAGTVYANQRVIDAAADNITYKDTTIPPSEHISDTISVAATSVISFDEAAEKRKLAEAEKNKTTVAEIYPWITEEAEPKKKVTTLAQLVRENKRKGMSKRHNLIMDLTEEVRSLRSEVEDVLFYDNEDTLQTVLQELWEDHHKLVQEFEEFMSDLTVDSPPPTPLRSPTPVITPEHMRADRRKRICESSFLRFFRVKGVDEREADKEFEKNIKESRFEVGGH